MIMAMGRIIVMSMLITCWTNKIILTCPVSLIHCLILLVYVDFLNTCQYGDDLEEPSNLKGKLDECKF